MVDQPRMEVLDKGTWVTISDEETEQLSHGRLVRFWVVKGKRKAEQLVKDANGFWIFVVRRLDFENGDYQKGSLPVIPLEVDTIKFQNFTVH